MKERVMNSGTRSIKISEALMSANGPEDVFKRNYKASEESDISCL